MGAEQSLLTACCSGDSAQRRAAGGKEVTVEPMIKERVERKEMQLDEQDELPAAIGGKVRNQFRDKFLVR